MSTAASRGSREVAGNEFAQANPETLQSICRLTSMLTIRGFNLSARQYGSCAAQEVIRVGVSQ
jgi:hypothetical protein